MVYELENIKHHKYTRIQYVLMMPLKHIMSLYTHKILIWTLNISSSRVIVRRVEIYFIFCEVE